MTSELIDRAMKDLTSGAHDVYGDRLMEVVLFGSCARGDFKNGSDIDVMILVDIPTEGIESEMAKIRPIIHGLDRKYDFELLFAPIVKSYDEYTYWKDVTPFYQCIQNEGVRYA